MFSQNKFCGINEKLEEFLIKSKRDPNFEPRDYDFDCHCDPENGLDGAGFAIAGYEPNGAFNIDNFNNDLLRVPVVFHVVEHPDIALNENYDPSSGSTTSIDADFTENLLGGLNSAFNNSAANSVTDNFDPSSVESPFNPNMIFELAQFDPCGKPTNGIVYHRNHFYDTNLYNILWDPQYYYNIVLVSDICTNSLGPCTCDNLGDLDTQTSGYSNYAVNAGINGLRDATVLQNVIGTTAISYTAEILIHETGHYFNLLHTFSPDVNEDGVPFSSFLDTSDPNNIQTLMQVTIPGNHPDFLPSSSTSLIGEDADGNTYDLEILSNNGTTAILLDPVNDIQYTYTFWSNTAIGPVDIFGNPNNIAITSITNLDGLTNIPFYSAIENDPTYVGYAIDGGNLVFINNAATPPSYQFTYPDNANNALTDMLGAPEASPIGISNISSSPIAVTPNNWEGLSDFAQELVACNNEDCCKQGDRICDTQPQNQNADANGNVGSGCTTTDPNSLAADAPLELSSCDADAQIQTGFLGGIGINPFMDDLVDPFTNYMSYSFNCYANFTRDQARTMRCALIRYRANLLDTQGPAWVSAADEDSNYSNEDCIECTTTGTDLVQIWDGLPHRGVGEIITVPTGEILVIRDSNIEFFDNSSGIHVERGAALIVENSLLTNMPCGERWKGIKVFGDNILPTDPIDPNIEIDDNLCSILNDNYGVVIVRDGSRIENAIRGIAAGEYGGWEADDPPIDLPQGKPGGGIIIAVNSFFTNNAVGIHYGPIPGYPFASDDEIAAYTAINRVENNVFDFTTTFPLPDDDATKLAEGRSNIHITLNNRGHSKSVAIIGNVFRATNNALWNVQEANLSDLGTGIKSHQSRFQIGEEGATMNYFTNLFRGISAFGSDGLMNKRIVNNAFDGVLKGITIDGVGGGYITSNYFGVPANRDIDLLHDSYGIGAITSLDFQIDENQFVATGHNPNLVWEAPSLHDNSGTAIGFITTDVFSEPSDEPSTSGGIWSNDINLDSDLIEFNLPTGINAPNTVINHRFDHGTFFEGDCVGLAIYCNEYNECEDDWFIRSGTLTNQQQLPIGVPIPGTPGSAGANLFGPNVGFNGLPGQPFLFNNYWHDSGQAGNHITNEGEVFFINRDNDPLTAPTEFGPTSNFTLDNSLGGTDPPDNGRCGEGEEVEEVVCPSEVGEVLPISFDGIQRLRAIKFSSDDEDFFTQFNVGNEVFVVTATVNGVITVIYSGPISGMVGQGEIIIDNIDGVSSTSCPFLCIDAQVVDDGNGNLLGVELPPGSTLELEWTLFDENGEEVCTDSDFLSIPKGLTAPCLNGMEIDHSQPKRKQIRRTLRKLLRRGEIDCAIAVIDAMDENHNWGRWRMLGTLFNGGRIQRAQNLLNRIPINSPKDQLFYNIYDAALSNHEGSGKTDEIKAQLELLAEVEDRAVAGQAEAILASLFDRDFVRSFSKTNKADINEEELNINKIWTLYPNPTSQYLNIQLINERIEAAGQLELLDAYGNVVKEFNWESGQQQSTISVENLPDGLYFLGMRGHSAPYQRVLIFK